MISLRMCIDVNDLDAAIAFYTRAFGFTLGRRFDKHWAELLGGSCPIDLLGVDGEQKAVPKTDIERTFQRHWTPVHFDVMVDDIDRSVERAVKAGATLERPIREQPYGRLANLADPFGHGVCLVELKGKGYDELLALKEP